MVAEAMLNNLILLMLPLRAGMSQDEINAILTKIAEQSSYLNSGLVMKEEILNFRIFPDTNFKFPTDSSSNSQALPFAALLDGSESVVVSRIDGTWKLDGKTYKLCRRIGGLINPALFKLEFQNQKWSEKPFDDCII